LPVAFVDLEAGVARPLELPEAVTEIFRANGQFFLLAGGAPVARIDRATGRLDEIRGNVTLGSGASTLLVNEHAIVFDDGGPRALLDTETTELLPLETEAPVPGSTALFASERYVVGLDERDWPVFRIDTATRVVARYAVAEPSDLFSFRDARYVDSPGDELFESNYGWEDPAVVLDDGALLVQLRNPREGRLWLVEPGDREFRAFGKPYRDYSLAWSVREHYVRVASDGARGCFCTLPVLRWEGEADADLLGVGATQLVARGDPSFIVSLGSYGMDADATGTCVIDSRTPPLVHDFSRTTSRPLDAPFGTTKFFPE
jgi:hypothetical protein